MDPATPLELTLSQAAKLLGYDVKTLRRLIKMNKLRAQLDQSGKYLVDRSDVWHILYDRHDWCGVRCAGIQRIQRTRDFKINETDVVEPWVLLEWGEQIGCEELPEFEITLGIAEIRRLLSECRRPEKSREECEILREEFRDRVEAEHRQRPVRFRVILKLDAGEGYRLCQRIASRVKLPQTPGISLDLRDEGVHHLFENALPHVGHVRSVDSYLLKSLVNFYRDRLRYAGIGKKGARKRKGKVADGVDCDQVIRRPDGTYEIVPKARE